MVPAGSFWREFFCAKKHQKTPIFKKSKKKIKKVLLLNVCFSVSYEKRQKKDEKNLRKNLRCIGFLLYICFNNNNEIINI